VSTAGYSGPENGRDVGRYIGVNLREVDDLCIEGHAAAGAHLRGPAGNIRTGAVLTMLDNVGGLCGGVAALPEGWVVSTNLAARVVSLDHVGPFRIDANVLRRGRNNVVTAVRIRDQGRDNALVADGVLTSAILIPENGPPQWSRPLVIDFGTPPDGLPPMDEWLAVRPVGSDAIEVALVESLRNPWGILHGGVVATLVDLAAEHATGGVTTDVVLHFLAPNRVGPVRASARTLGTRSDGDVLRVEIRDEGADRVTAVAVVTASPRPTRG
jgi:uncharacterized protein (TIGR00369 family)